MLYKNKISSVLSLSVLIFCSGFSGAAVAQQCDVVPEMVTKLFYPDMGAYTVWDADYGEAARKEQFKGVVMQGEGALAVGEMRRMEGVGPTLMFVRYDRRGKVMWEKFHSISGLFEVVKVVPYGVENAEGERGFVVLANIQKGKKGRGYAWMGFFNADGKMIGRKRIKDDKFSLAAGDISPAVSTDGWVVPVTASYDDGEGESKTRREHAVVYKYNLKGELIKSRSFVLGHKSSVSGLVVSKNDAGGGTYIATGRFSNDFGKDQGWLMALDEDLSIIWQKEFSRGKSAKLVHSVMGDNGQIIAVGEVLSVQDDRVATWALAVDGADGGVLWQRYYHGETGAHDYYPLGVVKNDDGLIALAMQAVFNVDAEVDGDAVEDVHSLGDEFPAGMNYVQLLTLNPRGVTLSGDAYVYGKGADAFAFSPYHGGQYVLVGRAAIPKVDQYQMDGSGDEKEGSALSEPGLVNLPDADMSDKAKLGLAKLRQNIREQKDDASGKGDAEDDSANKNPLTYNAWIAIAEAPDAYEDPCLP